MFKILFGGYLLILIGCCIFLFSYASVKNKAKNLPFTFSQTWVISDEDFLLFSKTKYIAKIVTDEVEKDINIKKSFIDLATKYSEIKIEQCETGFSDNIKPKLLTFTLLLPQKYYWINQKWTLHLDTDICDFDSLLLIQYMVNIKAQQNKNPILNCSCNRKTLLQIN